MPKNTQGGYNKNKKRNFGKQEIITKIDDKQMYAQIIKNEGSHMKVLCSDNITRIGRLNNRTKKGPRFVPGSYVVITLREFESDQKHCDIIGFGNPPLRIINVFKQNNPVQYNNDIEFIDESNNEFVEFEESKYTKNNVNKDDDSDDEDEDKNNNLNFDDIWDDKDVSERNQNEPTPTPNVINDDDEINFDDI